MSENLELYILASLVLGIGEAEVLILELLVLSKIRAKSIEITYDYCSDWKPIEFRMKPKNTSIFRFQQNIYVEYISKVEYPLI